MAHGKKGRSNRGSMIPARATPARVVAVQPVRREVPSLLAAMKDGNEYGSLVDLAPPNGVDVLNEVVAALGEIQRLRGRPAIVYFGNVVRRDNGDSGVDATDDLPFAELVASVPEEHRSVDVLLSTRGGSAHQISRFVNVLRARFDEVHFLIPTFAMSAGTLFALSGDTITMTSRACLGPIDPQVPTKDGRYVPAQALLLLVDKLQQDGDSALKDGRPVPWTAVRIIDGLDKKELADAITASQYSHTMAFQFLTNFKFRRWINHRTSGAPVTDVEKRNAANIIANALVSHDRWKAHGHAIPREVLWAEVRLLVEHPDVNLERAMVRMWALCHWIFERTPALKILVSDRYRYVKNERRLGGP